VLSDWAWAVHLPAAGAATTALIALLRRRFRVARAAAATQAVLIIMGWARAQYPHIVPPDLTLHDAAAPSATLGLLVGALALGSIVLFPSLWYLFRVFRREEAGER